MIRTITAVILGFALIWGVWMWGFCRFYVDVDKMAIVISKTGEPLEAGQILAGPNQRGVRADVLGEGRHFLNPVFFDWEIEDVVVIPAGQVGIVTAKAGTNLTTGRILAEQGEKGTWRRVLGPGKYRMNKRGYTIEKIDAVMVPIGYVGVLTSLAGEQAPDDSFAGKNQKGVLRDILQPGMYNLNTKEYKVDVVEVGINQVSLLGVAGSAFITKRQLVSENAVAEELQRKSLAKQQETRIDYLQQTQQSSTPSGFARTRVDGDPAAAKQEAHKGHPDVKLRAADEIGTYAINELVEFPSRDGFEISLDMTVEFELQPQDIAWVFKSYGDLPAVVNKIILPQILSVSRLKGSAYGAKDFIIGEGREKFQNDLTEALIATLKEKKIVINNALIRHVNVPMQILDPIQQASVAVEQDKTNKEMQNTARKQAQLNTELGLIEQRRNEVVQETEKLKAEIGADKEKQMAQINADALRSVAEIERGTAAITAERTRKMGQAEADVIRMVDGEKAKGQLLKTEAFGDPVAYSLWEFATRINPEMTVNILHTGPGTLWTDLEKATLGEVGAAGLIRKSSEKPDKKNK